MEEFIGNRVEVQTESTGQRDEQRRVDVNRISSSVLARLIEEVRSEEAYSINAYNRMHNRHNRSR